MKRVKLKVTYGNCEFGEIVELSKEELTEVGVGNYEEVGKEIEVSKKEGSDCSALEAQLKEANEQLALCSRNLAVYQDTHNQLLTELKECKKLDDFKSLQVNWKD